VAVEIPIKARTQISSVARNYRRDLSTRRQDLPTRGIQKDGMTVCLESRVWSVQLLLLHGRTRCLQQPVRIVLDLVDKITSCIVHIGMRISDRRYNNE
jgi:hypothetical protein